MLLEITLKFYSSIIFYLGTQLEKKLFSLKEYIFTSFVKIWRTLWAFFYPPLVKMRARLGSKFLRLISTLGD